MMKTVTVRRFRSNLAGILKDVTKRFDRYIISKRGEPEAVLMCVDDYEGWLETIEIMSDRKAMADIRAAKRELAAGKAYSFEEVFGRKRKI